MDKPDYGNIVDMTYFDTGAQSVLSYATVNGFLVGHDLRTNKEVWKLRNDPKAGSACVPESDPGRLDTLLAFQQDRPWSLQL